MEEIEFYFDWDNNSVVFSDGIVCEINNEKNSFLYKGYEFILESDVEKDLCYFFNIRYVNINEN